VDISKTSAEKPPPANLPSFAYDILKVEFQIKVEQIPTKTKDRSPKTESAKIPPKKSRFSREIRIPLPQIPRKSPKSPC
jgi:hypothetical protein